MAQYTCEGATVPSTLTSSCNGVVIYPAAARYTNLSEGYALDKPITLLNTVHDSVLCEIPEKGSEDIARRIADLLKGVPKAISETFGVKSPIEFPVDYSMGLTLLEVKHNV